MPRPRMTPVPATQSTGESDLMPLIKDPDDILDNGAEMLVLLRRVGVIIRSYNALGKKSDKFCRLCQQARLLKVPCPHTEIWNLTK